MLTFPHQRFPFLGLVGCAIAGIFLANSFTIPWWLTICCLAAWLAIRWSGFFWLGIVLAFATLHGWNTNLAPGQVAQHALPDRFAATVIGIVDSQPTSQPGHPPKSRFVLRTEFINELPVELYIQVTTPLEALCYGDRIQLHASLEKPSPPRNPGEFDAAAWLARNGIWWQIRNSDAVHLQRLGGGYGNPLKAFALESRAWIQAVLLEKLEPGSAPTAIVESMLLGGVEQIPTDLEKAFRNTGTLHLFSVSGLHVGMVGVVLWMALRPLGLSRRQAIFLLIPALFFYALLTGWKPASVRAAIMASIVLFSLLVDRKSPMLNSLAAAAFLILLMNTNELFNPGFQMSFSVVAAILLLANPLAQGMHRWAKPDPFIPRQLISRRTRAGLATLRWSLATIAVSASAWLGSLPLSLWYFNILPIYAVPANLLAIPLAFCVVSYSMVALVFAPVSAWLSSCFGHAAWLAAWLVCSLVTWFSDLPGSYRQVGLPPWPQPRLEIFDVGKGAASTWFLEDTVWQFDTGTVYFAETTLLPYLFSHGVESLDGLILSHGDSNHLGGAGLLLQQISAKVIVDSGVADRSPSRNRILSDENLPLRFVAGGDTGALTQNAHYEVLFPPAGWMSGLADDKTLVLKIRLQDLTILWMSDSGAATEDWLLAHQADALACDILIKGQHAGGYSGQSRFIAQVNPKAIIASSTNFPKTELLDEEWKLRMQTAGITIFDQRETGAVRLEKTSKGWVIRGFMNSQQLVIPMQTP